MNRLTTRIDGIAYGKSGIKRLSKEYHRGIFECTALVERLAEYEDAEEQGLLIHLPCKVGSEIWYIDDVHDEGILTKVTVDGILCFNDKEIELDISWVVSMIRYFTRVSITDFGKTIFLTREEAEQKLKEIEKGK